MLCKDKLNIPLCQVINFLFKIIKTILYLPFLYLPLLYMIDRILNSKNKKVKVSKKLKKQISESNGFSENDTLRSEDSESNAFINEIRIEEYFIEKIQVYLRDLKEEKKKNEISEINRNSLEEELEESRELQIGLLLKLRNSLSKIKELEIKLNLFKNELRQKRGKKE